MLTLTLTLTLTPNPNPNQCHGRGRLQAARDVRRQEGRVALGLDARAAELLGLGVARRKVAGQGRARVGPGLGWPPTTEGAPGAGRPRRGALSTCRSAITLPSSTLPRTYCPMQSSQKACAQPVSTAASAGGVSHMQMGQVTSAAGRSQSPVGGRPGRPEPVAVEAEDEDEEDPADAGTEAEAEAEAPEEEAGAACAVVVGGGLKGEAAPLSSWSLSRSMGAAAESPTRPRRAGGGRRGESTVRSTTARFR